MRKKKENRFCFRFSQCQRLTRKRTVQTERETERETERYRERDREKRERDREKRERKERVRERQTETETDRETDSGREKLAILRFRSERNRSSQTNQTRTNKKINKHEREFQKHQYKILYSKKKYKWGMECKT